MRALRLIIVAGGLLGLLGCAQTVDIDHGPHLDADGHRRSVVLATPLLQHLQARGPAEQAPPWYADRNDRLHAALAGYAAPTLESSVTLTRDRQHTSNGRTFDHFQRTTYSAEHRHVVR